MVEGNMAGRSSDVGSEHEGWRVRGKYFVRENNSDIK